MFVFSEMALCPERVPSVPSLTSSSVCMKSNRSIYVNAVLHREVPRSSAVVSGDGLHGDPTLCLLRDATGFNLWKHF